jgi:hypothetical protein
MIVWCRTKCSHETNLFLVFLPYISCRVLALALLRKKCFTWSSVRHIMMRRYGTVPRHLLVLVGVDSVACSCSRSKILRSFLTLAKRKALQSTLRTGLSCNHFIILGLFQFEGRGLGTISYSSARQLISQRYSRFCGRIDAFGSFDHSSLSKEKSWVPSSITRPMDSTCKVFFEFCASKYIHWHLQYCCTPAVLCNDWDGASPPSSWAPPLVDIVTPSPSPPPCLLLSLSDFLPLLTPATDRSHDRLSFQLLKVMTQHILMKIWLILFCFSAYFFLILFYGIF